MIRRRLIVSGDVQGVFFRETMRREALARDVAGWVRNRADGTVEAVLEGEPDAVDALLAWAGDGPSHAHVTDVQVETEEPASERGFTVR